MGIRLAGIDVSGIIKREMGQKVLADPAHFATLVKVTPGTRAALTATAGTNPTTVSYTCKGFIDTQGLKFRPGTTVAGGRFSIVLIGDTIDNGSGIAPAPGDRIIIEGTTYVIPEDGKVDRDPAAATYTCEVAAY